MVFQTRIKLAESTAVQWIPLQAIGARPAGMKEVKLSPEEDAGGMQDNRSFLQKYVSIVLYSSNCKIYTIMCFFINVIH